jgi:hypothetical protein
VFYTGTAVSSQAAGIEVIRYDMDNGSITRPALDTLRLSGTGADPAVGHSYDSHINATVDASGTMACVWTDNDRAYGAVWGPRGQTYSRGEWTSAVDSVMALPDDSVWFYETAMQTAGNTYGTLYDSIRVGHVRDTTQQAQWSPWIAADDANGLETHAKSHAAYFQVRIGVRRHAANPLFSPYVLHHTLRWNVQPRISSLDSVSIGDSVYRHVSFGDTLGTSSGPGGCFVRSDSIVVYTTVRDKDGHGVTMTGTCVHTYDSVIAAAAQAQFVTGLPPLQTHDSVYTYTVHAVDSAGWRSPHRRIFFSTRNDLPRPQVRAVIDTNDAVDRDTVAITDFTRFTIQQEDSVVFLYTVYDSNDSDVRCFVTSDGDTVDSVDVGDTARYVFRGERVTDTSYAEIAFLARDPDSAVRVRALFGVNHAPVFQYITCQEDTFYHTDSLPVSMGALTRIRVHATDSDLSYWDTLSYAYETAMQDTQSDSARYRVRFMPEDTLLRVIVRDVFQRADTAVLYLQYPWFAQTTHSGYMLTVDSLRDSLRAVLGGELNSDSLVLPLHNSGTRALTIDSIRFGTPSPQWMALEVSQPSGVRRYSSLTGNEPWVPVSIPPDSTLHLGVYFTHEGLSGDGYVYDTLRIYTNDYLHGENSIPVRMEYNDLPRVVSFLPHFVEKRPYWLSKRTSIAATDYTFPPHGCLVIAFSEGMDTTFSDSALVLYSVFDSVRTTRLTPIPYTRTWNAGHDTLRVSPVYDQVSPWFGVQPLPGHFIPTDSIAVTLTSGLTDDASTRSGPNALDVNRDYERDTDADTTIRLRIDSIGFSVVSISPAPGSDTAVGSCRISLTFSDSVLPSTLDTGRINNRSLVVTSSMRGADSAFAFDSVVVRGAVVHFYPATRFYYTDRVHCTYRAVTARDELGYPVDADKNGIAATVYDSSDTSDNVSWHFDIRPIEVVSVTPDSGARDAPENTTISVTFDQKLFPHSIDIDSLRHNRSMAVSTKYSAGHQVAFRSIAVQQDSMTVVFTPDTAFFSRDSIRCRFAGFASSYSYAASGFAVPGSSAIAQYSWFFRTGHVSFYTYPNPYKPSQRARHREMGGICFKNLHALATDAAVRLRIEVYNVNGFEIYDSRQDNESIVIGETRNGTRPQWIWDTRNHEGERVASGLYLYAIIDEHDKVLTKGKLVIVR